MPRTPDEFPGERIEESILFVSGTQYPTKPGEVTYVEGVGFAFMQDDGLRTLSTGTMPSPTAMGQILMALTPSQFSPALPLTSYTAGLLINNSGHIIVSASL